jgi:hypothetical protein
VSMLPSTSKSSIVLAALAALALTAAACTGGGSSGGAVVGTPTVGGSAGITPVIINSELVLGENRFSVGILDNQNAAVTGAQVAFRFFKVDGDSEELRAEAQATPVEVEKSYTHVHEDGTVEAHSAGESGVYIATVSFDETGQWKAEVATAVGGTTYDPIPLQFTVIEKSPSVAVGAPAPRSETLTLDDVSDIAEIDTSEDPIPEMHTMTIAEAVTSGKPSVIAFATPAFCLSRFCGPAKDVVDSVYQEYKGAVNFVHVEPYDVEKARSGEGLFPVPATEEWGLLTEPWVFVVDSEGIVAAKFEGVVTVDELRQALDPLLAG